MSNEIKDIDTGAVRSMTRCMFDFHTDEAGVLARVKDSDNLVIVGAEKEVPVEIRDEEPIEEEKPQGFFKTFTQKGVTE
jgi:hypothetical protein